MAAPTPPDQGLNELDGTEQTPLANAVVGRTYRVTFQGGRSFIGTVVRKTEFNVTFQQATGTHRTLSLDSTVELSDPDVDIDTPAIQQDVAPGGRRRKTRRRRRSTRRRVRVGTDVPLRRFSRKSK